MHLESIANSVTGIKKWGNRYREPLNALMLTGAYLVWTVFFRLLTLSFITYFLRASTSHFQEISEVYSSNEITLVGLCSLAFLALMLSFGPLSGTYKREVFTPERIEKKFFPGFIHGAVLASGVVLAFLLSGRYGYLGFYIRMDEALLAITNVIIRVFSLAVMVYSEEYIFRHRILGNLSRFGRSLVSVNDRRKLSPYFTDLGAIVVTAALYCLIKAVQFEIGISHLLTLLLVSIAVGLRTLFDQDFALGAGFWAAILFVFHPLLSLPVLGNEFSGVVLIKFLGTQAELQGESVTARFLTGGVGGPISSFAFQLVLLLDITRNIFLYKKMLLLPRLHQIR